MHLTRQKIAQILIVAGVAVMILSKLLDGKITWYINERFVPLTVLAVVLLAGMVITSARLALSGSHKHEQNHNHEHSEKTPTLELAVLALPVLIGLAIPSQPLSSSAFDARGLDLAIPANSAGQRVAGALALSTDEYSILDWFQAANQPERVDGLAGQQASVVGFVYHDTRLPDEQFMVGRFVVTCCVADSFPTGMAVAWAEAASLESDTWVEVSGPVSFIELDGVKIPLINAETVEPVGLPEQPYIFP